MRGYFGIGCLNMKTSMNYGTLFRTAQIMGADFVFLIGARFKRQASDTIKSWRHIPTYVFTDFTDFNNHRPYGCRLIGIELMPDATPLNEFRHPEQACYLLGAEDHGLTSEALDHCQDIICLPGERSMNVAVAGSIVLYDRHIKSVSKAHVELTATSSTTLLKKSNSWTLT
jgi:tRNA G18 (ribose-2'-O)-methylase SpoU